ncbi:Hsp20/alpha crystallin family protein [bacterium]|nr:Hsp20/alpha crystallin family protein [bacterium]
MAFAWDPFREMDMLHREIDRLFSQTSWRSPLSKVSFLPGLAARAYPLLRLDDRADEIVVEALAPGIDLDALKVSVINQQLRIEGSKPAPKDVEADAYHRNERSAGAFVRILSLPAPVNPDKITADYKNGILTIKMPKAEHAKPRRITVNVA